MKCNALPTISNALDLHNRSSKAAEPFVNAMLFEEMLRPLEKSLGNVGEMLVSTCAQRLALSERHDG